MGYQIKILSDKEFDKLPYEEAPISLGVADTNEGKAYVRYVANGELQKYLVNHELEHLVGEDRDEIHHDGKGIYYKGFGNVFSGLGQAISNIPSGLVQGAANIGSGIGQSIAGAGRSLGQAMGFGGGFQGGANPRGGLAASAAASPSLRAPMDYFKGGGGNAALAASNPAFRMPTPSLGGGGAFRGAGASGSFGPGMKSTQGMAEPSLRTPSIQRMTAPSIPMTAQAGGGVPSKTTSPPVTTQSGQQGTLDIFGGISKGLDIGKQAMSLFGGQTMGGFSQGGGFGTRLPDLSELPSVQAFKNYDFRGNIQEMDPALQDAINRDFDRIDAQEEHDFRNRWKNVRPGADIENDSVFARDYAELKRSQGVRRADQMSKYRFEMLQTNLGLNKMELERLQEMAQLDIDTISFNTGLDAAEAMNLKRMFGYGTSMEGSMEEPINWIGNTLESVGQIAGGLKNAF